MARVVARKIRDRPALLDRARDTLARWKRTRASWPHDLEEWERLIEGHDLDVILEALLEDNEEGARRRQSSPFTGILTQGERKLILVKYEEIGD